MIRAEGLNRMSRLEKKNLRDRCQIIILSDADSEMKLIAKIAQDVVERNLREESRTTYLSENMRVS